MVITIGATLGVVMSSNGIEGSMSIIVWLLVWRFVLGIGIGTPSSSALFDFGADSALDRCRLSLERSDLLGVRPALNFLGCTDSR